MKLLFDENLSPRLVNRLAKVFPDSSHVDPTTLRRGLPAFRMPPVGAEAAWPDAIHREKGLR